MLRDVRGFSLLNQHLGFFLPHLAATDHVVDQVARTLDREGAEPSRRSDHLTHGAGHLAASFQADLVRPLRHFGRGVACVCSPMPRATARSRTGRRCVTFGDRVVVSLRQIGHGSNALLPPSMEVEVVVRLFYRGYCSGLNSMVHAHQNGGNYMIFSHLCKVYGRDLRGEPHIIGKASGHRHRGHCTDAVSQKLLHRAFNKAS